MRSTFAALRLRNYRLFATGSLVSNIGTWMQRIAQDWLVLTLTGSAGALGITTGLQFLPILLFSPFAGVLADRFPKRRILAVTQVAMGVTAGILGLLAITGWVAVWHVYVIAFLFGIGTAIDTPARQAFVHEMVRRDQLPNAVGLNSASFNLARVIGPAIAGGLIAALGSGVGATGWVIMLNAASYLAVIVSLARMRAEELFTDAPGAAIEWPAPRRHPLCPRASRHHARDGRGVLRRHVRPQLPDDDGIDGDRGLRQGRRRIRHPRLGARRRFARGLADGGQAGGLPPTPRHRRRRRVRDRRHGRRADAVVPDVRGVPPGVRLRRVDVGDVRQLVRPDSRPPRTCAAA